MSSAHAMRRRSGVTGESIWKWPSMPADHTDDCHIISVQAGMQTSILPASEHASWLQIEACSGTVAMLCIRQLFQLQNACLTAQQCKTMPRYLHLTAPKLHRADLSI